MAGFLDRSTRVIDFVLTGRGKRLLSQGTLEFHYWVPFDDEINYSPFISTSASLSPDQLSSSIYSNIEDSPIREATTGYRDFNFTHNDTTNVINPMFTMPQGQLHLPKSVFPNLSGSSIEINVKQRKVVRVSETNTGVENTDVGMERFDSTKFAYDMTYARDSFPTDYKLQGFRILIFKSGSGGLVKLEPRRDMDNDLSFGGEMIVYTGAGGGE